MKKVKKREYFLSYLILYTWAVNYWPILPSPPTSGLSILFWQGLVGHLLSMPSQSSHHMGFCSISLFIFNCFQHHFFALILFGGGNWGAEIARTYCAGIFTSNKGLSGHWAKSLTDPLTNELFLCLLYADLWATLTLTLLFSYCWINIE